MSYQYDAAGRMTRITWPDTFYAAYDHDLYGAVTAVRENGAASGAGVLATWAYNDLGRPVTVARAGGAGASTTYGYDGFARLDSLAHDAGGTADDVTLDFAHNPSGQIIDRTVSNPAYVYAPVTGSTAYDTDGLNAVTDVAGTAVTYDANKNTTGVTGSTYGYDAANRLTSANAGAGAATFTFDPADRLYQSSVGGAATRFQYAGAQLVGEYDGTGALVRRHVPGLGLDGVVTSYDGAGTTNRHWLLADERGSVIALAGGAGAVTGIDRYDEYGVPASGNTGRFQYTGQVWLPEAGVYHYRARAYAPQFGRFMQTDPAGYEAGANLYAYVGGDPVNWVDPSGLERRLYSCNWVYTYMAADGASVAVTVQRTCEVELNTGSYFEAHSGGMRGFVRADRTRPVGCPTGRYGQASVGAAASGAALGRGGSAGASAGVSMPTSGWRGTQLFLQTRMAGGGALGAGGGGGGEVAIATQRGRLPTGLSGENSAVIEGGVGGGSVALAATQDDAQAGASAQFRARAGTGGGAYAIFGGQNTNTYATPPIGCE